MWRLPKVLHWTALPLSQESVVTVAVAAQALGGGVTETSGIKWGVLPAWFFPMQVTLPGDWVRMGRGGGARTITLGSSCIVVVLAQVPADTNI